jgi:iron(III) transport system permease protein
MALGVGAPLLLRALAGGLRTAGARAVRPAAPGAARGAWVGVGAFAAVAVALPWMALLVPSFTDAGRPSLVHWARVLGDARVLDAGLRSALLAGAVATAVALAGGLVAWAATRGDRLARAVGAAGRLGVAVPGSVLGLGLLVAFSQELRVIVLERVTLVVALADGAALLGIAWALRFLPLPLDLLGAAVQGVHPSLEEAARLSGAGPARAVAGVTLPLVARALGSAWLLVFVGAACEVTLSTLLAGPRAPVLGTLLFQLQTYADPRAASVLGVLASAVLVGAVALGGRR